MAPFILRYDISLAIRTGRWQRAAQLLLRGTIRWA